MANKEPTKTTLKKGDNLPPRGRATKTIILEAIRDSITLALPKDATKDQIEVAFFKHVSESAFDLTDKDRGMCLKLLGDKGWANIKPCSEMINFEFDEKADLHVQASQVMKGVARGEVPPDLGNNFVNGIASMLKIKEITDIDERLKAMESKIDSPE